MDMAFVQGEEFEKVRFKTDLLPGTGNIYDLTDMDVGYYGLVGRVEGRVVRVWCFL
ncbi:hypothetical protein CC80DRAFT_38355 [Byssothecium circinans]|uniref:Uncharacterized protein n=1 Tax=Byssothecium circinans TaxID=147558 RepID=A0A6A5TZF2_9PLEO|nr:hypothetical protein CC80DRAFT_38355 [Byssothecium circinans]